MCAQMCARSLDSWSRLRGFGPQRPTQALPVPFISGGLQVGSSKRAWPPTPACWPLRASGVSSAWRVSQARCTAHSGAPKSLQVWGLEHVHHGVQTIKSKNRAVVMLLSLGMLFGVASLLVYVQSSFFSAPTAFIGCRAAVSELGLGLRPTPQYKLMMCNGRPKADLCGSARICWAGLRGSAGICWAGLCGSAGISWAGLHGSAWICVDLAWFSLQVSGPGLDLGGSVQANATPVRSIVLYI